MSGGRKTRSAVHRADRLASVTISVGGIAVLAAVLGICAYLVWIAAPLLAPGSIGAEREASPASPGSVAVWSDDQSRLLASLHEDGTVRASLLAEGPAFAPRSLTSADRSLTAISAPGAHGRVALGFDTGEVELARVDFADRVVGDADPAWVDLGDLRIVEGDQGATAYTERTPRGAWRVASVEVEARAPVALGAGEGEVRRIDYAINPAGREYVLALRADGTLVVNTVRTIRPLGGGEPTVRLQGRSMLIPETGDPPEWIAIDSDGASAYAVWADGRLIRWALGAGEPTIAEQREVAAQGAHVTLARMMQGGRTLVIGDSAGAVRALATAPNPSGSAPDGLELVETATWRPFGADGGEVRVLGLGARGRLVVVASGKGDLAALHMTSGKVVARAHAPFVPAALALHPRLDGMTAVAEDGRVVTWALDPGYADASVRTLAAPVVYEGALEPGFVYQSSSADDTAELKLSLVPLVFGTLKATVISMLIAAPLAVMAALFTTEFMHRRVRASIKPAVELMASLPSVVLGFFAMAVVAPAVGEHLMIVLAAFVTVPLVVIAGAQAWSMCPPRVTRTVRTLPRLLAITGAGAIGIGAAMAVGPLAEHVLFSASSQDLWREAGSVEPVHAADVPDWAVGRAVLSADEARRLHVAGFALVDGVVVRPVEPSDGEGVARVDGLRRDPPRSLRGMRAWLNGNIGSAAPGWIVVFALFVTPLTLGVRSVLGAGFLERVFPGRTRVVGAGLEWGFFAIIWLALSACAVVGAIALDRAGIDARDTILGSYSERNTLVVGLVMGFAVIPLIYTISEDALASVPANLRSASLGCGATPWQTAVRVVLPVAGSGIFSACMIGLGRAVGETMIMLMATGNTPTIDLNIFEGFRTLAANIATELPEAERGSTHYRVLFLCGLVLFVMTLAINTTAELVRQRFRKRSAAL